MHLSRSSLVGTIILLLLGGLGGLALAQAEEERGGAFTLKVVDVTDVGQTIEASDPRLSGTWMDQRNCHWHAGFGVRVASVRLETEGGTWLGRMDFFSTTAYDSTRVVLEGQGGYSGLTAILETIRPAPEEPDLFARGIVIDHAMPTMPEEGGSAMRKLWAAGAAIVLCLALGGIPVVGQEEAAPSAGEATSPAPGAMVPAMATGQRTCNERISCDDTMSDPRVSGSGPLVIVRQIDVPPADGYVVWGSITSEGPDGGWIGPLMAMAGWGFSPVGRQVRILEGTGGYEGWTYVNWDQGTGTWPSPVEGIIYQGPAPDLDLSSPPAEEPSAGPATSVAPVVMLPAKVTGEMTCEGRGKCEDRASDPRVSGSHEPVITREVRVPEANGYAIWGTTTIPGPDGAWTGKWVAMAGWDFSPVARMVRVLEGTGAYAGWTYVSWPLTPDGEYPQKFQGAIYRGPAPAMGSLLAEAE